MTLLTPWLLAALVLLVPVAVAFLMRRRRSVLRVPSTLLWQSAALRRIRNRKIRYLTRILALVACLLALAALIFAAARPRSEAPGETVAVVVDVSASMGRGESGSPLDQARRYLDRMLWTRSQEEAYVIIAAGDVPRRLAGPTTSSALLEEAADALEPERGAADLGAAIELATSLVASMHRPRVVVLRDGGVLGGDLPRPSWGAAQIQERHFSYENEEPDNVGIVTFAARRPSDLELEDEVEVLITVATSSSEIRQVVVAVEAFEVTLIERHLEVPADGEAEARFRVRTPARELRASVMPVDGRSDQLSTDDEVHLVRGVVVPPRVLMVADDDAEEAETFFAEQALRAAGVSEIVRVSSADAHLRARSGDVVVALTRPPAHRPPAPVLFLGTEGGGAGSVLPVAGQRELSSDDEGTPTRLRSVAAHHALLRGVDLDGVTIQRALSVDVPEDARALVELDGGAVILAGGDGAEGWIYLGIDTVHSDLVLRVAFPVLIANSLALLGGATQVSVADTVPRSEVALHEGPELTADEAPALSLGLPRSPSLWLALIGVLLLGVEVFTWRKGWTR